MAAVATLVLSVSDRMKCQRRLMLDISLASEQAAMTDRLVFGDDVEHSKLLRPSTLRVKSARNTFIMEFI